MMFLRDILFICVVLHFSQSFYKSVECALVITPGNVAVLSGQAATLHCASDQGSIVWKTTDPGSTRRDIIYNNNVTASSVSSYISVKGSADGSCSLNIIASATAAKRYICIESATGAEASSELIVLENPTMCNVMLINGSFHVSCSIVSTGNWYPVVECEQRNEDGTMDLVRNQTKRSDNNKAPSTLTFTSKKELHDVICSAKFQQNEKPKETTATNIPEGDFRTLAYRYSCVAPPSPEPPQDTGKASLIAGIIVLVLLVVILVITVITVILLAFTSARIKKRYGICDHCVHLLQECLRHKQRYYLIVSQLNGQALEVEDTDPGVRVVAGTKHGRDNQLWYDDLAKGTIRTKINSFCLDVENGQFVVKPFQQGDPNQQWERRGNQIANRNNPNEVLDIVDSDNSQRAKVTKNQSWIFE